MVSVSTNRRSPGQVRHDGSSSHPRTRPPLLAPVLEIVTPRHNIAVVLLSSIFYLLRTPEPEQEHLQQIRYLNSLILRTNRISSSFTAVDTQTSHHQTFWLQCSPILIHYLVRYQILHTSLAWNIINSIQEQGRWEEYVHVQWKILFLRSCRGSCRLLRGSR